MPERLNIPADRLQKEMEWVAKEESVPPQILNAIAATVWLLEVDAFREAEEEFMLSGDYARCLPDHRAILSVLIARGEAVVLAAKKSGMARTPAHFTVDDLQATLNSLHRTLRREHGPKNPQKTDQLIGQLLDGAERQNR